MKVALHRIDELGTIRLGCRIPLLDRRRVFQADRQGKATQHPTRGLLARLVNVGKNLRRRAILRRAKTTPLLGRFGSICHQHRLHEIRLIQQGIHKHRLFFSLARKPGQAFGCGFMQHNKGHQLVIESIARQKLIQLRGIFRLGNFGRQLGPQLVQGFLVTGFGIPGGRHRGGRETNGNRSDGGRI